MRRSCGSLTSLTSNSSVNSRTKIFNNRDFQKYIGYIEEDVIKVSNDYYYFAEKYDKRICNFINRYEDRTNKLYIDLRNREAEYRNLNNKIEYICKEVKNIKDGNNTIKYICDNSSIECVKVEGVDRLSNNILFMLCVYTLFVISMVITY
jgi:hypothetical protein